MLKIDNSPKKPLKTKKTEKEGDIYQFSQNVIKELSNHNIPSIPGNYSIYFDKLLDSQSNEFKEKISAAINTYEQDAPVLPDSTIFIEKEIKQGFVQIKSMLQAVALIYKNLGLMKNITKKHLVTLQNSSDLLAVQNVLSVFNNDLVKLLALMSKHTEVIRINYEEIGKMFKSIEEQTIYDSTYEVYNKKFLINSMQAEIESSQRYGYSVSFMMTKVHEKILFTTSSLKDKNELLKRVAQIILRTSRRSDLVAHYGDGYFVVLMKHTDFNGLKQACARIKNLLSGTPQDIGGRQINIELNMVAAELNRGSDSMEQLLSRALDTISSTHDTEPIFLE